MRLLKTTALGAAWLAGQFVGFYPEQDTFARRWKVDARFEPAMDYAGRDRRYAAWKRAVAATISAVLSIPKRMHVASLRTSAIRPNIDPSIPFAAPTLQTTAVSLAHASGTSGSCLSMCAGFR